MQNNIFSLKRFASYGRYNFLLNWKLYIMFPIGAAIVYFSFILFLMLNAKNWSNSNWQPLLIGALFIMGSVAIGNSFQFFRKK